jgi:hypothetical protein
MKKGRLWQIVARGAPDRVNQACDFERRRCFLNGLPRLSLYQWADSSGSRFDGFCWNRASLNRVKSKRAGRGGFRPRFRPLRQRFLGEGIVERRTQALIGRRSLSVQVQLPMLRGAKGLPLQ